MNGSTYERIVEFLRCGGESGCPGMRTPGSPDLMPMPTAIELEYDEFYEGLKARAIATDRCARAINKLSYEVRDAISAQVLDKSPANQKERQEILNAFKQRMRELIANLQKLNE